MAYNTEKCACNVRNEVCRFGLASSQILGPSSYLKAFLGDGLVKHETILTKVSHTYEAWQQLILSPYPP